jgi:hypothetical protein
MNENLSNGRFEATIFGNRLAVVAMALFAVYQVSVLVAILPPRWFDPIWQISAIKVAVDAAAIPLLGLALLHLAAYLCPSNLQLQKRHQTLARLAILAALGFLLMVPLQGQAVWTSYRLSNSVASQQQAKATQRAEAIRQAITEATSPQDLEKRLQALQRPDSRINFDDKAFAAIPFPDLKQQLLAQLDKAEGEFKARNAPPNAATAERVTRESLRVMVSSLAFSIAFAALAQRRNSPVPFLLELPYLPARLIACLLPRRRRPGQTTAPPLAFLKSASRREEDFFNSLAPPEDESSSPR